MLRDVRCVEKQMQDGTKPLRITSVGKAKSESMVWTNGDELRMSVVVRACFSLLDKAQMKMLEPDDGQPSPVTLEQGTPPLLPRCDLMIQRGARPESLGPLRLRLLRDGQVVLDYCGSSASLAEPSKTGAPTGAFPVGFDFAQLQRAAPSLQTCHLRGDEWLEISGQTPKPYCYRSQLPGAVARVLWWPAAARSDSPGEPLEVVADTLLVDLATWQCTICWRGSLAVRSPAQAAELQVVAGVACWNEPVDLVAARPNDDLLCALSMPASAAGSPMAVSTADRAPAKRAIPFQQGVAPVAPPSASAGGLIDLSPAAGATVAQSGAYVPDSAPLPWEPTDQSADLLSIATPGRDCTVFGSNVSSEAAPFHLAQARADKPARSSTPIPGAPWQKRPPPPPRRAATSSPPALASTSSAPAPASGSPAVLPASAPPALVSAVVSPPPARLPAFPQHDPLADRPQAQPPPPLLDPPAAVAVPTPAAVTPEAEVDGPVDLRQAVLARMERGGSFDDVDLSGADLSEIDFRGMSFVDATLEKTILRGCRFDEADLSGAQLREADLTDASLLGAKLEGADFSDACLLGAAVCGPELAGAQVSQAQLGALRQEATISSNPKSPTTADGAMT